MTELTYAKVGGPPDDWHNVEVTDLDTGEKVERVIEVDADAGWLRRHKVDAAGHTVIEGDEVAVERIEGRFKLSRKC